MFGRRIVTQAKVVIILYSKTKLYPKTIAKTRVFIVVQAEYEHKQNVYDVFALQIKNIKTQTVKCDPYLD